MADDNETPTTLTPDEAKLARELLENGGFDPDEGAHSGLVDKLDTIASGE